MFTYVIVHYFRLGAILAPQLSLVLPGLTPGLPTLHLYIFSIVSLLGSVLAIIVPDTVNTELPDNYQQVTKDGAVFSSFENLLDQNQNQNCTLDSLFMSLI